MSMNFEFFDGAYTRSTTPTITIRKGGVLVLNGPAVDKLGDDVTHVEIGYDADKHAIGLRKAAENAPGRYLLRKQSKGDSRIINGKRMFTHHGLNAEKARTFDLEEYGKGLFGVTLADEHRAEAPSKAKAKKAA